MEDTVKNVDFIISPSWIIPVVPSGEILSDYSVAVRGSKIISIHPSKNNKTLFQTDNVIELKDHVLVPGFINSHTHVAMNLLRGFADDLPLMKWLEDHIWPAESKFVSPDFAFDGSLSACYEMLRGGTTCFNDMYFFPEQTGKAAISLGIRAVLGITVIEFPTNYASDPQDYLTKGLATRDELESEELIKFAMAPHSPYTVSDKTFKKISVLANQLQIPIHIHLHESNREIEESVKQHGRRPLHRLNDLGMLSPSFIGVHSVHLNDLEIELLATQGCSVVHCPSSNLKLASGFSPIGKLIRNNVNIAIGTDGAASNNKLDMISEMRLSAILAKAVDGNAETLPAHTALKMATLGGAKSLAIDHLTGSIEVNKLADLTAINLSEAETHPHFDIASLIVYSAGRENVTNVWVNGNRVVNNKQVTGISNESIIQKNLYWKNKIEKSKNE